MSNICVLGSINMDMVYEVNSIPKEGETIEATGLSFYSGGKGLNQAIAASRLGGEVFFIGRVGSDEYGDKLSEVLKEEKVDVKYLYHSKEVATGQAVIILDKDGKNCITVLGGANMSITKEDILRASEDISKASVIIAQFEVPMERIIESFSIAKEGRGITILNPAPAKNIPDELYSVTDIITPNESELEKIADMKITNVEEAIVAARRVINKGVKIVIATLGAQGALVVTENEAKHIEGERVKAIDTTAAGDSFIGAIAYRIAKEECSFEENLEDIISFANKAAAITVQRKGAQPSLPYLWEIDN